MRRMTGILGATALVGALVAGSASTASTTTAEPPPEWIPFQQPDVTLPAGSVCDFEVFATALHDREFFRNVSTWPDGSPRTQLWKGPLIMRIKNNETGESVVRDISGRQIKQLNRDGSLESILIQSGHTLGGMAEGSDPGKGAWYVGGTWSSMVRNDDGTSRIFLGPDGTAENLCETLAP